FPPSPLRDQVLLRTIREIVVESNVAQGRAQLAAGNAIWAESYFKEAITRSEEYGSPDQDALGNALRNLGEICRQQGRLDEAKLLLKRAFKIKVSMNTPGDLIEIMISHLSSRCAPVALRRCRS